MITKPISTKDEAVAFITELVATGCMHHPDDPAATVINGATGELLFTPEEAVIADEQMHRCFELLGEDAIYEAIAKAEFDIWGIERNDD